MSFKGTQRWAEVESGHSAAALEFMLTPNAAVSYLEPGVALINPEPGFDHAQFINDALADPAIHTVVLGEGLFTLTTSINVPSGKTLQGQGRDVTILQAQEGFVRDEVENDAVVNSEYYATDIVLEGFTIDANKLRPDGFRLLGCFMREAEGFTITGVDVKNATGYAHHAYGADGGTYTDCYTYNANVHFEQMASQNITLTDCHARDGDGDIGAEGYFHPLVGSKNITYIDCTGYGNGYSGFNLLSLGQSVENIRIINCDIEIFRDDAGTAIIAHSTLPVLNLQIEDSSFISHGRIGARLAGVQGTAVNSYFQGETIGVQFFHSTNGTAPNFAVTDSVALGLRDVTGTGTAFGVAVVEDGVVTWDGGSIEARAGFSMIPVSGPLILVNSPELINSGWNARLNYTENDAPTRIAPNLAFTGSGLGDLAGGTLLAGFQWLGRVTDELGIATGNGIIVGGNTVFYNDAAIATFTGGAPGEDLLFTLTGDASSASVQALIRAVTYFSASDDPARPSRGIEYVVTDAAGASVTLTATVTMTVVNDAPSLALGPLDPLVLDYAENDAPTLIAPLATVADPDSPSFAGGSLVVAFAADGAEGDQLRIATQGSGPGEIDLVDGEVTFGGVVIGAVSGGSDGEPLTIVLNAAATAQAVEALVRAIAYSNSSDTPSPHARSVTFTLNDGDGAASSLATATIRVTESDDAGVEEPPRLHQPSANLLSFVEGDGPLSLLGGVTLSDVDSPGNLDGGTLQLSLSGSGGGVDLDPSAPFRIDAQDLVYLVDNGDGTASEIVIGTIEGAGTTSISILLTAAATIPIVNLLIASFAYADVSEAPAGGVRTLTLDFDDGAGLAASVSQSLLIVSVDDAAVARNDSAVTTEKDVVTGSVFIDNGSGADSDIDGPALEVARANGSAAAVGTEIRLASGALLRLNADGSYSYNPNGRFSALISADKATKTGAAESSTFAIDSFTYTLANGSTATVQIRIVGIDGAGDRIMGGAAADVLTGTTSGDDIRGLGGDDQISGGDGSDLIDGGAGADRLAGGTGDDTFIVDQSDDLVDEEPGEGYDTVRSVASFVLPKEVERLFLLGAAAIDGTGNDLANVIVGNSAANVLIGGGGSDQLDGGGGADEMIGGFGDDLFVVDDDDDLVTELSGQGTDTVNSSIDYALPANVEHLTLTGAAVAGTGNERDNRLTGNNADNLLFGGRGADLLNGRGGNDEMHGGVGNDIFLVEQAGDLVIELAGEGVDTVQASIDYVLPAEVENLILTEGSAVRATGNALNNGITGNSLANIIDGGAGADMMFGGLGDDTYYVDHAGDRVNDVLPTGGFDTVFSSVSFKLEENVEKLVLTGTAHIFAAGGPSNNILIGNTGNNTLDGGLGSDEMQGGLGNDTYVVESSGDSVIELDGGGVDTVVSSISYILSAYVENLRLTGNGNIFAAGNNLDNFIVGNDGNNTIDGGGGADSMQGGLGNDTYIVDNSRDRTIELHTNGGIDTVVASVSFGLAANVENLTLTGTAAINALGNGLANELTGNSADNRLEGGLGADRLTGGAGADTFVYRSLADSTAAARDVIQDFRKGDRIDLSLVDAVAGGSDDAFTLVGAAAFSGKAGELRLAQQGRTWFVEGDVDGDKVADLIIEVTVTDALPLAASDFLL